VVKETGEAVKVTPSAKMSKSKNNVVDPVRIIESYGADTARWFVLSDSPPERDVEWTASGAEAAHKHLARVWRIAKELADQGNGGTELQAAMAAYVMGASKADDDLMRVTHKAIHALTGDIDSFGFNAAIARLYGFTSAISKSKASTQTKWIAMQVMAQLMSPITPHLAEEIWAMLGGTGLVAKAPWPVADDAMLAEDTVTLPVQVNGKRRAEISVPADMEKSEVEKIALATEGVIRALDGAQPKKIIVVPGRIVNVVV